MALEGADALLSIPALLAHRATRDPEGIFLISEGETLSFGALESRAEALAAGLHSLGIGSGDRVAVLLPCIPEFAVSLFALAKLGASIVPLNPGITAPELRYMLRHSGASAAIAIERHQGIDFIHRFEEYLGQLPELEYLITVGEEDLWYDDRIFQFEDLLSKGQGRDYETGSSSPEPFLLLYTAGTTGKPKGVELDDAAMLSIAAAFGEGIELSEGDRVAGVTAFFHIHGLVQGLFASLHSSAALVLQREFDGRTLLDLVERQRVRVLHAVPATLRTLLGEQRRKPRDLSSLRSVVVGGGLLSDREIRDAERGFGASIRVTYSMTEASSVVTATRAGDPDSRRLFTVGRPLRGVEVRVTGPGGERLPEESVGEIRVRSPGLLRGYFRQPSETARAVDPEGWLRTGDLGMIDEEGYLHLVGSARDVIVRAGLIILPQAVEDRLRTHPAVQDVAVVGVPDEMLGEAIRAFVVPVEGAVLSADDVLEWCRVTLPEYRVPDGVDFLEEFPRNPSGSVNRSHLVRSAAIVRADEPN